jgi:hypothetical protein
MSRCISETFRAQSTLSFTCSSNFKRNIHLKPHPWPRNGLRVTEIDPPIRQAVHRARGPFEVPTADTALRDHVEELMKKHNTDPFVLSWDTSHKYRTVYRNWIQAGELPLSEYRLTFGKHKGKRLDEIPDTYLVKYLIPQGGATGLIRGECPRVVAAVEDFLKRHPEVKSQAGNAKTKPLKEGILKQAVLKKRG